MQIRKAAHRGAHANLKRCRRQRADHPLDGRIIQRRRNWNWWPAEGHQISPGFLVDDFHDSFDVDGLAMQIENVSACGRLISTTNEGGGRVLDILKISSSAKTNAKRN